MLKNAKLRSRIEVLLAQYPHLRDDDQKLLCNIWRQETIEIIGNEAYNKQAFQEGLAMIATGKLSNPESIRRTRQKIQEMQPLLRGQKYKARQKHEGEVRKQIRQFT